MPRLFGGCDHYIAKGDLSFFAALQIDGAGRRLVAVDCAAGDAGDLPIIDDGLAILYNGDFSPDESDVEGLPRIRRAGQFWRWSEEAIDSAGVMAGRLGF